MSQGEPAMRPTGEGSPSTLKLELSPERSGRLLPRALSANRHPPSLDRPRSAASVLHVSISDRPQSSSALSPLSADDEAAAQARYNPYGRPFSMSNLSDTGTDSGGGSDDRGPNSAGYLQSSGYFISASAINKERERERDGSRSKRSGNGVKKPSYRPHSNRHGGRHRSKDSRHSRSSTTSPVVTPPSHNRSDSGSSGDFNFFQNNNNNNPSVSSALHSIPPVNTAAAASKPANGPLPLPKFENAEALLLPAPDHLFYPLSAELMQFHRTSTQTREDKQARRTMQDRLQKVLDITWPGAQLHLFGSSASGFSTVYSDLDFDVVWPQTAGTPSANTPAHILGVYAAALERERFSVQSILNARVPILKVYDLDTRLNCDVVHMNKHKDLIAWLMHDYAVCDPRVVPLVCAVKYWSKMRDIGDSSRGSLSSFGWTLMVLQYLQVANPPVVPNFQNRADRHSHKTRSTNASPLPFGASPSVSPRVTQSASNSQAPSRSVSPTPQAGADHPLFSTSLSNYVSSPQTVVEGLDKISPSHSQASLPEAAIPRTVSGGASANQYLDRPKSVDSLPEFATAASLLSPTKQSTLTVPIRSASPGPNAKIGRVQSDNSVTLSRGVSDPNTTMPDGSRRLFKPVRMSSSSSLHSEPASTPRGPSTEPTQCLGALLAGFFKMYGTGGIDKRSMVVSIRHGRFVHRKESSVAKLFPHPDAKYPLVVEDPFDHKNNVARSVRYEFLPLMEIECSRAYEICCRGGTFAEMCIRQALTPAALYHDFDAEDGLYRAAVPLPFHGLSIVATAPTDASVPMGSSPAHSSGRSGRSARPASGNYEPTQLMPPHSPSVASSHSSQDNGVGLVIEVNAADESDAHKQQPLASHQSSPASQSASQGSGSSPVH